MDGIELELEGPTLPLPISSSENLSNGDNEVSDPAILESSIYGYFSRCNVLSKSIISEQRALIKQLGERWKDFDSDRKDALLDLLFVEDDVRQKFMSLPRDSDAVQIQESFPRIYMNSGQKINLDFENDLWSWRDEHSGPFSWMSRSQQDLTLTDLELENISKPQPKTLRLDTENPDNLKKVEQQFLYPSNCWTTDIIDDYKRTEKNITLSPCVSLEFSEPRVSNEEVNEAFEENTEDIISPTSAVNPLQVVEISSDNAKEQQDPKIESTHRRKNSRNEKKKRSPSPKKILRSSSLRRSPSKCSDQGEQQLISKKSDDSYEEQNSFSNPLIDTQWSSFVGENEKTEEYNMPTVQVIDRGFPTSSPYQVQGDHVQLITPADSPALRGSGYTVTNDLSGWSAESTPDHTTHLLKGMEEKAKKAETSSLFPSKKSTAIDTFEEEEVLTVESRGDDIKITTESEKKRDSDIPTTGFDFLDNW